MKTEYDNITLMIAEKDRHEQGKAWMEGIVAGVTDTKTLNDEDRAYYYACVYVLTQTTDHAGKPFVTA